MSRTPAIGSTLVRLSDGLTLTVWQITPAGAMGTRESDGPKVWAHVAPGGYGVTFGAWTSAADEYALQARPAVTPEQEEALIESARTAGTDYALDALSRTDALHLDEYPLSGEWSDGLTAEDVVASIVAAAAPGASLVADDLYSDVWDAIVDAWENGYRNAHGDALGDLESQALRSNAGVVSYAYQAEEYSPDALVARLVAGAPWMDGRGSWITAGILAPAAADMTAEDVLNQAAAYLGIDREDESSYDSDDFPKVQRTAY